MKYSKFLLVAAFGLFQFSTAALAAPHKLLDCNLPDGDTQQATVVQDGRDLFLDELDMHGRQSRRPLSAREWQSKKLRLKAERGAVSTLSCSGSSWWLSYKSAGYNGFGEADCRL